VSESKSVSPEAPVTFDQSLARLQQLVRKLETGELTLEQSLQAFEEGVGIARQCQAHLTTAEQKVEQLIRGGDEKTAPEVAPFNGE
jgi:exodeoxyribonuclease VII small subunit